MTIFKKIVSLEKNLALQPVIYRLKVCSENFRLNLLANEDSNFGSMFLEFEQIIEKCIAKILGIITGKK